MPQFFTPTCSLPPDDTRFTSTPNVRGTLDIVWTCLSILLLCTWSVQHLNIQPRIKPRTFGQSVRLVWFVVKRKAKWMLMTLVAPEFLIGLALSQRMAAGHGRDTMKEFARDDGVEWSLEHSHFADMGGFVICFPDNPKARDAGDGKSDTAIEESDFGAAPPQGIAEEDIPSGRTLEEAPSLHRAVNLLPRAAISIIKSPMDPRTQSLSAPLSREIKDLVSHPNHGIEALREQWASRDEGERQWTRHVRNGELVDAVFKKTADAIKQFTSIEVFYEGVAVLSGSLWVLNTQQLFLARKFGIIKSLPQISLEGIEDKNKGDAAVKLLALFEVAWLIVQLIVRQVRILPSTQLEIMSLAFAGSTFFIYILLWYKPQDALVPVYLAADGTPTRDQLQDIAQKRAANTFGFQFSAGRAPFWIPDNSVHDTGHVYRDSYLDIGVGAGAVLFGALHFISWNQHFPTPTEQLVWRVCLGLTVGIPPLFLVMGWMTIRTTTRSRPRWLYWINVFLLLVAYVFLPVLYILARGYIMVEVFRTLAFLPSETYVATFTAEVPQIA